MTSKLLIVVPILILLINQQVDSIFMDPNDDRYEIPCNTGQEVLELNANCTILKLFNQTQVDQLEYDDTLNEIIKDCACQLANMWLIRWKDIYDSDDSTRRLYRIVTNTISRDNNTYIHPPYIWSDFEIVYNRVSIYTATNDYFEQVQQNRSLAVSSKLRNHEMWKLIRYVCKTISRDEQKLYRYLENVNRISRDVFMRLIQLNEPIEIVYQASKACKMLILRHFSHYKLRPDNDELVAVDPSDLPMEYALDSDNNVEIDVDQMLKEGPASLMDCSTWNDKISLQELANQCPMMVGNQIPDDWKVNHPSSIERFRVAAKCGCQLLLHNSTWEIIMRDRNVAIMSRALTNYMSRQQMPNIREAPLWTIYGWFQDTMSRFVSNKKMSVKEIVKTIFNDQDTSEITNRDNEDKAIELLRRGCNFIMLNYKKGSKEASELKLIQYLDNLRLISQDSLFVFRLTLQDPSLFKLHALSKMCQPIVR